MMKGDGPIMDTESKLALKFVMSGIKRLVVDDHGIISYMENLDEVLKDVFGIKHFTKRLNDCYDDKETIIVINEIGMKNLMQICNNRRVYSVFAELVLMNVQIHRIHRLFRKMERKGKKKDKDIIKELDYITDLYKDAIKTLRKKFGFSKKKSSYKKRFRSVSELVDSRKGFSSYDDDDGSLSSMIFDDIDDDDYDDDEGGATAFDQFVRRYTGGTGLKKKGKTFLRSNTPEGFDDEDDYDDIEEESEIDEKLNTIASNMSALTSTMQAFINSRGAGPVHPQRPVNQSANDSDLANGINNLTKAVMMMAEKQNQSIDLQTTVLQFLANMDEDELEAGYDENVQRGNPQIIEDDNNHIPSREELINIVNNSNSASFTKKHDETIITKNDGGQSPQENVQT